MNDAALTMDSQFGYSHVHLSAWYEQFSHTATAAYTWKTTWQYLAIYSLWASVIHLVSSAFPNAARKVEDFFFLKVMCWFTGMLSTMTIKEAVSRYQVGFGALLDFRDSFRAFWYLLQNEQVTSPGARLITDVHLVAYVYSLARFVLREHGDEAHRKALSLVHPEFRSCVLFEEHGIYGSMCSSPEYNEILLISWLKTSGVYTNEISSRWQGVRQRMCKVINAQRVRNLPTAMHLWRIILHIFVASVPVCGSSITSRLMTPVIAMVLFSLASLAEEFSNPFGLDEHDLPWPSLLSTVSSCALRQKKGYVREVVRFFNEACTTSHWSPMDAPRYFGPEVLIDPAPGKLTVDAGKIQLSLYPTQTDIKRMDVVGNVMAGDPDVLFSTGRVGHALHSAGNTPRIMTRDEFGHFVTGQASQPVAQTSGLAVFSLKGKKQGAKRSSHKASWW